MKGKLEFDLTEPYEAKQMNLMLNVNKYVLAFQELDDELRKFTKYSDGKMKSLVKTHNDEYLEESISLSEDQVFIVVDRVRELIYEIAQESGIDIYPGI